MSDDCPKTSPPRLIPTRPDTEVAEDLRRRMTEALQIFEEALREGFLMSTELQRDPYGRLIVRVKVSREY